MARSLANVKVVASMISNKVSCASSWRSFAAVSKGVEASRKTVSEKEPSSWIPDPVTGYYRPENTANEIDVAELREVLMKQSKNRKN